MSLVENPLTGFEPCDRGLTEGSTLTALDLKTSARAKFTGFTWTLTFPFPNAYRTLVTGPDRPRPPHDNVIEPTERLRFTVVSVDQEACQVTLNFPQTDDSGVSGLEDQHVLLRVSWKIHVAIAIIHQSGNNEAYILRDLAARSYGLTEHGIIRHWVHDRERVHLGLGEKAAPIDLTGRSFQLHAADAGLYDAYHTDPLYKHTPFLISTPRPAATGPQGLTYAIYHASNSNGIWDWWLVDVVYTALGGLEEWILIGKGVQNVVETLAEMAGKPKLVGRDWLGYLASTMLLSDLPNAQEELSEWPELCRKHDIPCSAMHLSSGFTMDEKTGKRWVFHLNRKMYPDFSAMVRVFHQSGMLVVPNVKPYLLESHPDYDRLAKGQGLFLDPMTGGPSKQNLWSHHLGYEYEEGSWIDLSAEETRKWWAEGCRSLIDLGVDGIWNDNSEFFTRNDTHLCKNDFDYSRTSHAKGVLTVGFMGRMAGNEMMGRVSNNTLLKANPERRTYVLTRSGNPATFKYACSTWSGDNATSWHNMRGSQHIQLNSALSLMQSTGADVGGFGGPLPGPELFVRWIQLGVTHSRFCIHSAPRTPDGQPKLNSPWEYPEVLPIVRDAIKWRYVMLPFINNLMWLSHLNAHPPNAPLFYGQFASDPALYTSDALEGFDAWFGVGQVLVAPAMWKGQTGKDVYFPKSSQDDTSLYFDLHAPFGTHRAGSTSHIATPIEHGGLFAREGCVIPVGKAEATVTAISGPARRHVDGVDTVLRSEGGFVGLDNWRGVRIFPADQGSYEGQWIEDDGISSEPTTYLVRVSYEATKDRVGVKVEVEDNGFTPLWAGRLYLILPAGDRRSVERNSAGKSESLEALISEGWHCHVLDY